jgi:hypothetical protein
MSGQSRLNVENEGVMQKGDRKNPPKTLSDQIAAIHQDRPRSKKRNERSNSRWLSKI